MKGIILFLFLLCSYFAQAQDNPSPQYNFTYKVGIGVTKGTSNPSSAHLVIGDSATNKALILPRVVDTNAIATPRQGMIIYSLSDQSIYFRTPTSWVKPSGGGGGGSPAGNNFEIQYRNGSAFAANSLFSVNPTNKWINTGALNFGSDASVSQKLIINPVQSSAAKVTIQYTETPNWDDGTVNSVVWLGHNLEQLHSDFGDFHLALEGNFQPFPGATERWNEFHIEQMLRDGSFRYRPLSWIGSKNVAGGSWMMKANTYSFTTPHDSLVVGWDETSFNYNMKEQGYVSFFHRGNHADIRFNVDSSNGRSNITTGSVNGMWTNAIWHFPTGGILTQENPTTLSPLDLPPATFTATGYALPPLNTFNNDASFALQFTGMGPNLGANGFSYMYLGKNAAARNQLIFGFSYRGDGSAANSIFMGTNSINNVTLIDGNGRMGINKGYLDNVGVTLEVNGTDAILFPSGNTAARPSGVNGHMRYNSELGKFEGYEAGSWKNIITTTPWVTTGSDIYYATGNVGIGSTQTPNATLDVVTNNLGVAPTTSSGILLETTTPATNGSQQVSPILRWRGLGFSTNFSLSKPIDFRAYVLPIQGAISPLGQLIFQSSTNGGSSWSDQFKITANGQVVVPSGSSNLAGVSFDNSGNLNTGMYLAGVNSLGFTAAGNVLVWDGSLTVGNWGAGSTLIHAGDSGPSGDRVGQGFTFATGKSSGAGASGDFIFQTSPSGAVSGSYNPLVTRLSIFGETGIIKFHAATYATGSTKMLIVDGSGNVGVQTIAGGGSVTDFSAGDLSPLFTTTEATTTTTPALTFNLTNAAANTYFGNNTGSTAAPAYNAFKNNYAENSQTITTGSSTTITTGNIVVYINPSSVLASHTITMPASPQDKQVITFFYGGTIAAGAPVVTTLVISANSGQSLYQSITPTNANGGDEMEYRFESATTSWRRIK